MDLTLTEDQRLVQETAREFLADRGAGADARTVAGEPGGYSEALWRELVDLGWTGLPFAESYGGAGSGFLELCLLLEELARARVPTPLLSTVACCGLPIGRFGSAEQRAEWLPAIAGGQVVSPVRAAPGGRWGARGSDVSATEHGDALVLDGSAQFAPYAGSADALLVLASLGDSGTLVASLVDTSADGVRCVPLETVGTDRLYRVDFAGVSVPGSRRLGGEDGVAVADAVFAYGAAATSAAMVGGAQGVLDMTVEYATQREQFGKPIGAFQAVQHHCANLAVDVLGSRFIAYEAIWRLAADPDAGEEVALAVSSAKAWVSDAYQRVCATGHQVHGAIGFTAEHDLHYHTRHATGAAVAFGDADHHTDAIATALGL